MNEGVNDRRRAVVAMVAVAIVLMVLGGLWWSSGGPIAPRDASALARDTPGEKSLVAAKGSIDRKAQETGGAAVGGVDDESALIEWKLRVLVIDEHGEPVRDANVTAGSGIGYDAMWARMQLDGGYESVAQTDGDGRATLDVLGPFALVGWHGQGASSRGGSMFVDRALEADAELVLALYGPLPVRGIVRNGDGTPAAGAIVEATAIGGGKIDPVHSQADGTFQMPLLMGKWYKLRAGKGEAWTPLVTVWASVDDVIELKFARANPVIISGEVFTSVGEPAVDATVYAVCLETGARRSVFTVHGQFEMKLLDYGAYSLMAIAPGSGAAKSVRAFPTPGAPHARITLRMTEVQFLRGRVVDEAGKPRPGASVSAKQVEDSAASIATHSLQAPAPETVRTEDDGTFELRVSPDASWEVTAYSFAVGSRLVGKVNHVASGADNIEVRVRPIVELRKEAAERRETCPFRLHVTTPGGGGLARCRVYVSHASLFMRGNEQLVAPVAGEPTALKPLPADSEVWVQVRPEDPELAIVSRGAIQTAREPIDLHIELQPWAHVPVLVVDASGKPAPACSVFVRSSNTAPPMDGRFTDHSGRTTLFRVPPGRMQLVVRHPASPPVEQTVEFLPGRNAGMIIRLPSR